MAQLGVENGFDIMRARLRAEFEGQYRHDPDDPCMADFGLLVRQCIQRVDVLEVQVRGHYFLHGRNEAEKLIARAEEFGVDSDLLVEFITTELSWEPKPIPTIEDINDPVFSRMPGDDTPLLTDEQMLQETRNGFNHRIAEHLGIE